ncbi:MAG TPA: sialidase family protein [Acidimicrobiales bacterium]|nr:sialidase family protein [Acidimicrobiales bacterium]
MRTATRRLLAAAALAVLIGACSAQADGPATPAVAVQANKADKVLPLSRDEEGPALLVDKDDSNTEYLAYSEMATGACKFSVSTDRGATWRVEAAPTLEPFTQNCAMGSATSQNIRTELKQAPDGTIYDVFQANAPDRNGTRSVLIGRSSDRGRSWQTVAIDPGTPAPEPGVDMEVNFEAHIAIDPADPKRIYAMWRRSYSRFTPPRTTNPYMSVSDDGGATWSPPQLMFSRNNGFDGPRPIVIGNRLWAFWRESAPPTPTSQDGPSAAPPVTRLFASVSTDQGKTWTDHEITNVNDASEPIPVWDASRKSFYVVWHDNRSGDLDVYFSTSKDGITWAEPKRLNDDPPDTKVGQHYPILSESPNGRLDVAWYDWRDDPFPPSTVGNGQTLSLFSNRGKFASVYMTSSRDGGRTWTPNRRINDVPIDRTIGSWENNDDVMAPIAIASSDFGAVVAWSDTRNGNAISNTQDIFTSTVTFGKPTTRHVTGFQAGVVGMLLGLGVAMCLALLLNRRQHPPIRRPVRRVARAPEPVK